jgi:ribosomal protein S27AE
MVMPRAFVCAQCGRGSAAADHEPLRRTCKACETYDYDSATQFDTHNCKNSKEQYGDVQRNMGGTGAPHPWMLWLDAECTEITYCPFCSLRLRTGWP